MNEKLTTEGTIYLLVLGFGFVQALPFNLKRNLAPKFSRAMDSNPGLFPFSFPSPSLSEFRSIVVSCYNFVSLMAMIVFMNLTPTLSTPPQPTTLTLALVPHTTNNSTQTLTATRTSNLTPTLPSNHCLPTAQLKCNDNGRVHTKSLTFTHLDYE